MAPPPSVPQPSAGGLFGPLFGRGAVPELVSDTAYLQAMLDFEAGLARALAAAGVIDAADAEAIARACVASRFDTDELGRAAVAAGNPVVPLVVALTAAVPDPARAWVHHGATSQDVLDTATMLVARSALGAILADLDTAAWAAAELAEQHRGTLMAGRTLLQQAVPITFGLKAAGWLSALDAAASSLARAGRELPAVQLGGAAGTLAALGDRGPAVVEHLGADLGLVVPTVPWHTDRARLTGMAAAVGGACATVAKVAGDVVLLAQTEIGEVREGVPDRGGSSTLPHKRNPVAAITARASAGTAPGLVADLLAAAGAHEHERAAGAWQAEWLPLRQLVIGAGCAASWLADCLGNLQVDGAQMRVNLERSGGLFMAERITATLTPRLGRMEAHRATEAVTRQASASGPPFHELLAADPVIGPHLEALGVTPAELLDPAGYLGAADALVDAALAAHHDRCPGE